MSKSLEISDEVYERIAARAAQEGMSPAEYAEKKLAADDASNLAPARTLYDRFAGRLGKFEGKSTTGSTDCGKQFTDYLEEKYREGRL